MVRELPKGLIRWYEFQKGSRVLLLTGKSDPCEILKEALLECGLIVDMAAFLDLETGEASSHLVKVLRSLCGLLNPKGRLLLGTDNRLGIRYFCGDRDVFTERNFDGIENYVKIGQTEWARMDGRAYAKAELIRMLEGAGFFYHRFYSVFPDLLRPQALYAEDYIPEEELDVRIIPQYHSPETVFLEEERLYTTLIENGMFHAMANGYLIECPLDGHFANAKQVTGGMRTPWPPLSAGTERWRKGRFMRKAGES